jgi:DNA-binding HxlR family transcriptional regulator
MFQDDEANCVREMPRAPNALVPMDLCPARDLLDRIGSRWALMVIVYLGHHGVLRFNDLKRRIQHISQRMLTVTLRDLERDGLVTRTVKPVVPPHVEYQLTAMGGTLLHAVSALVKWANEHQDAVRRSRDDYDASVKR